MNEVTLGDCRLIHGDCREVLPGLGAGVVDAVVTDPPYGIGLENHGQNDGRRRVDDFTIVGDACQGTGLHILEWARANALTTLFFASPNKPWPGEWRNLLVWDKGGAVGGGGDVRTCWKRTWELIQIARNGPLHGPRDGSVLRFPVTPQDSLHHPAQKPVALMAYLIAKMGAMRPLDPFMGSGTTGVACMNLGRKFIGIELERRYFDLA